jgi:hypothetical protein
LPGARPEPGTQQGATALKGKVGRRLAAVRVYCNWDSPYPDADAYSWYNCRPGTSNPWNSLEQLVNPMRLFAQGKAHRDQGRTLSVV